MMFKLFESIIDLIEDREPLPFINGLKEGVKLGYEIGIKICYLSVIYAGLFIASPFIIPYLIFTRKREYHE